MTAPIFINPVNVVAPNPTIAYISTADYLSAPTAVQTDNLVNGGNAQANLVELANVILRASDWANGECYQILAATTDVQVETGLLVHNDGTVRVPLAFWPLLQVNSILAGSSPSTATAVADTGNITMVGRRVLIVPVNGAGSNTSVYPYLGGPGSLSAGDRAWLELTYVNGWAHTLLTANAIVGATSITISPGLGQYAAGTALTIYDGANTEKIVVGSSYTGGTTLPLASALVYAHTVPTAPGTITVTALPPRAREAVISLTSQLIKNRGSDAIVMDSIDGQPSRPATPAAGGGEDYQEALKLLKGFQKASP